MIFLFHVVQPYFLIKLSFHGIDTGGDFDSRGSREVKRVIRGMEREGRREKVSEGGTEKEGQKRREKEG